MLKDRGPLLAYFNFPAKHLRTSNPVESAFATLRLRQRIAGNRTKALTMAFKLLEMAQMRWLKINGAHLLPQVRAGAISVDGVLKERN